ncbi:MAG: PDDEXK nuclease domain-containing protein [Bacteroidota bacterium]
MQKDSLYIKKSHHTISLLDTNVNSAGEDMGGFHYASKLYFTKSVKTKAGGEVSRVYSLSDRGRLVPFAKNPAEEHIHIANPSLTVTGKRIYYNLFEEDNNGNRINSYIWFRDKDFNGDWSPQKRLPRFPNLGSVNLSNPATGILRDTRSSILFFVVEQKNSNTQKDIWGCYIKNDGSFSKPFKLPFNSNADEISPFFDVASQTLYFSSNSPLSFGGFDVFRTHYLSDGNWSTPENLGRPINSYYNDAFFSLHNNGLRTYFSSDRPNENCPNVNDDCRYLDIYKVNLQATLQLFLFDDFDKTPLNGCNVELMEMPTETVVSTYLNLPENIATVGLRPNRKYQLIISKPDYQPIFEEITAEGMNLFKINYLELRLTPMHAKSISAKNKFPHEKINKAVNLKQEKIDTTIIVYSEIEQESQENKKLITQKKEEVSSGHVLDDELTARGIDPATINKQPETGSTSNSVNDKKNKINLSEEKKDVAGQASNQRPKKIFQEDKSLIIDKKKEPIKEESSYEILRPKIVELLFSFDTANLMQIKNLPNITLSEKEDPVDLLFFHKKLNCTIAVDLKSKNFEPDDVVFMNKYLSAIKGLYKKNQQPSIGITLFNGSESQFVIYTFQDSNANVKSSSYINTFLFPEHYRNILPDPTVLVKLLK